MVQVKGITPILADITIPNAFSSYIEATLNQFLSILSEKVILGHIWYWILKDCGTIWGWNKSTAVQIFELSSIVPQMK